MSAETLALPQDFTADVLQDWYSQLSTLLEAKKSFVLDATGVSRVDGAAIQFLLQIRHTLEDDSTVLVNASEPLIQAMSKLGVNSDLSILQQQDGADLS